MKGFLDENLQPKIVFVFRTWKENNILWNNSKVYSCFFHVLSYARSQKSQTTAISCVVSVLPSVCPDACVYQRRSHWINFRQLWYWELLWRTYLLIYSMVQSPPWAANWFAASKEIPRISRNPKVHYRTHKRPPPVSILSQPNPVHILTSHLLEVRPNIIYPSTTRSPQWSLSFRFPHQDPIHPPLLTLTRHMKN